MNVISINKVRNKEVNCTPIVTQPFFCVLLSEYSLLFALSYR